jgi:RNA polymerase sigma-B factor
MSARTDARGPDERAARTLRLLQEARLTRGEERRRLQEEAVVLNMGVAESIARRFCNRGEPLDDLTQVAYIGLTKAVQGFDPDKADQFLKYAVPTISGELKRYFRDLAWTVRPPRRIQELQAAISAAAADLNQELCRSPRPSELAHRLEVSVGEVSEALASDGCFSASSLDERGPTQDGFAMRDMLTADDDGLDRAEVVALLRPACHHLQERERHILFLRYFRGWTQAEIASELGVTQMQVSRLLARILGSLREEIVTPQVVSVAG